MNFIKEKGLYILLAVLVIMQFFQIDKTNPESDPTKDFAALTNAPADIAEMMKNACYDCHSYHTKYPWYTSIAPLSFWIRGHIRGGRMNVNYSTWSEYPADEQNHIIREMIEEIEESTMPLKSYTWLHPEGKLNEEDKEKLIGWLRGL